jgi:hypothetical protein
MLFAVRDQAAVEMENAVHFDGAEVTRLGRKL